MGAKGFSPTGQPILNRKYTLTQGDLVIPVTVVGKMFGQGGNADLLWVVLEEKDSGGREMMPWPLEADEGAEPIAFTPGWPT